MSEAVVSKDLLIELAGNRAAERFQFLMPVRSYLRTTRGKNCPTCGKEAKRPHLPDELYRAIVGSATFSQEAEGLADFLGVEHLRVPGRVTPA